MLTSAHGHAGTTYGKLLSRGCWVTDGFSPDGTAMAVTRDSIASGALSACVRPLRAAKPYVAGVPTTLGPGGSHDGGDEFSDLPAVGIEVVGRVPGVGGIGKVSVVWPEVWPHHGVPSAVDLPPAARIRGEFRGTPDADASTAPHSRVQWETSSTIASTVVPAKLFCTASGRHDDRSTAVPSFTAPFTIPSSDRSM
jgi:hypothetical protein